jgi:hypothetical protein
LRLAGRKVRRHYDLYRRSRRSYLRCFETYCRSCFKASNRYFSQQC